MINLRKLKDRVTCRKQPQPETRMVWMRFINRFRQCDLLTNLIIPTILGRRVGGGGVRELLIPKRDIVFGKNLLSTPWVQYSNFQQRRRRR